MTIIKRINKFRRQLKFSANSIYVYIQLKDIDKVRKAVEFHERKVVVKTILWVLGTQILILALIMLLGY